MEEFYPSQDKHCFQITRYEEAFSSDLNGCTTTDAFTSAWAVKNKLMCTKVASNHWSSTENNANNAYNLNFNNGNLNNNNKYNSNVCRASAALDDLEKEEWLLAYDDCCRRKKKSEGCVEYTIIMEFDLWDLALEVKFGIYNPSTSICFCVTRPKLREVFAANFRDRIVHHWLMMKLNPLFERRLSLLGDVSFNCRRGFGTLTAVNRVKQDICIVTNGYTTSAFVGRFDFIGFFMAIDKDILCAQCYDFIYAEYNGVDIDIVWRTLRVVIQHNPSTDCEVRGKESLFALLEPHKSLRNAPPNKGMPIGNLTSQILANFHLSFFDFKMIAFCRWRGGTYERFVDDFVIVMPTAQDVVDAFNYAKMIAWEDLHLKIHDDKLYIQHYTKGVMFIGNMIKIDRVYLSNRTFGRFVDTLISLEELAKALTKEENNLDLLDKLRSMMSSVNSYIGFTVHVNGYAMRLKLILRYRAVYRFVYLNTNKHIFKVKGRYNFVKALQIQTDGDKKNHKQTPKVLPHKACRSGANAHTL